MMVFNTSTSSSCNGCSDIMTREHSTWLPRGSTWLPYRGPHSNTWLPVNCTTDPQVGSCRCVIDGTTPTRMFQCPPPAAWRQRPLRMRRHASTGHFGLAVHPGTLLQLHVKPRLGHVSTDTYSSIVTFCPHPSIVLSMRSHPSHPLLRRSVYSGRRRPPRTTDHTHTHTQRTDHTQSQPSVWHRLYKRAPCSCVG